MLFWLIAAILLSYLVLGSFALLRGRQLRIKPSRSADLPNVSIIIPTFNEEKGIETKLEEALALDYPTEKLEILVVDESSDNTAQIVRMFAEKHPAIVRLLHQEERSGLAIALDRACEAARGDILIKTDCDSKILRKDAVLLAVSFLARPDVGAVAGVYRPAQIGESHYRGLLHMLQVAESNLWSAAIAHGCFAAFKKDVYEPPAPNSLADDTEIFVGIAAKGHRAIVVPQIEAVEQNPLNYWGLLAQRSRRAQGIIRVLFGKKGRGMATVNPQSFLVVLIDAFLIAASPFVLLSLGILLCLSLSAEGWFGFGVAAGVLGTVAIVWLHRRNSISSFLDSQLAAAIGLLKCLRRASGVYERIE